MRVRRWKSNLLNSIVVSWLFSSNIDCSLLKTSWKRLENDWTEEKQARRNDGRKPRENALCLSCFELWIGMGFSFCCFSLLISFPKTECESCKFIDYQGFRGPRRFETKSIFNVHCSYQAQKSSKQRRSGNEFLTFVFCLRREIISFLHFWLSLERFKNISIIHVDLGTRLNKFGVTNKSNVSMKVASRSRLISDVQPTNNRILSTQARLISLHEVSSICSLRWTNRRRFIECPKHIEWQSVSLTNSNIQLFSS